MRSQGRLWRRPNPATVIRIKDRSLRVRVAERAQDAPEVAAVLG